MKKIVTQLVSFGEVSIGEVGPNHILVHIVLGKLINYLENFVHVTTTHNELISFDKLVGKLLLLEQQHDSLNEKVVEMNLCTFKLTKKHGEWPKLKLKLTRVLVWIHPTPNLKAIIVDEDVNMEDNMIIYDNAMIVVNQTNDFVSALTP